MVRVTFKMNWISLKLSNLSVLQIYNISYIIVICSKTSTYMFVICSDHNITCLLYVVIHKVTCLLYVVIHKVTCLLYAAIQHRLHVCYDFNDVNWELKKKNEDIQIKESTYNPLLLHSPVCLSYFGTYNPQNIHSIEHS